MLSTDSIESFLEIVAQVLFFLLWCQILDIRLNELQGVGFLCSNIDFFISCIRFAKENVFLDVCIEKDWLLHDEAALFTKCVYVILVQVLAIDQHLARVDVVKSKQNVR